MKKRMFFIMNTGKKRVGAIILCVALILVLTMSFTACSNSSNPASSPDNNLAAVDDSTSAAPETPDDSTPTVLETPDVSEPVAPEAKEESEPAPPEADESIYDYPVAAGDIMEFGGYEWRVLDLKGGKALILSEKVTEKRAYHSEYKAVVWADCALRKYLNEDFYNSFTEEEQAQIAETHVITARNPWYGQSGGAETDDKIFILSLDELVKYFGDSGKLYAPQGAQYMIDDEYNSDRKAYDANGDSVAWWLRSTGQMTWDASGVYSGGFIDPSGIIAITDETTGVRPALWLNVADEPEA